MPKNRVHERLWFLFFVSLVAATLTFPTVLHGYGAGLDAAYVWAYNHLFYSHFPELKNLIFTYGPLGYLKFSQPENALSGILFALALRCMQALLFLLAQKSHHDKLRVWDFVLLFVLLKMTSYDLAFASIMICGGLIAERKQYWQIWIPGIVFAALGLYIKFSIGMLAFLVFGGYLAVAFISKKITLKQFIYPSVFALLTCWAFGVLLSGELSYALVYISNALRLSSAYGAALSMHPENNKMFLWIAIFLLFCYPLIVKKTGKYALYIGLLAGVFVTWKHGIVREEPWHIFLFVQAFMTTWFFLVIVSEKRKWFLLFLALFSMFGIWRYTYQLGGVRKFFENENGYYSFYDQVHTLTNTQIRSPKQMDELHYAILPEDIRELIGNQRMDVYPWDLNYVAVNDFNWSPRPPLQSIDFNPWLDKKSADFYLGSQAPEFILWHYNADRFDRELGSFEERYLLNAEPLTVDAILCRYEPISIRKQWTLFRKKENVSNETYLPGQTLKFQLGEMIPVPKEKGLLKADVALSLNALGKLVSIVYKEPAFFIRYKWQDGTEFDYNILRHNAISGIWINPFLSSMFFPDSRRFQVDSIGFFSSNNSLTSPEVSLSWRFGSWPSEFVSKRNYEDTLYLHASVSVNEDEIIRTPSHGFSDLFHFSVDSLPATTVELQVRLLSKVPTYSHPRLVLSIDKDTLNSFWTAAYNDAYLPTRERWGSVSLTRKLDLRQYAGHEIKVYLWNESIFPFQSSAAHLFIRSYPPDSVIFIPPDERNL